MVVLAEHGNQEKQTQIQNKCLFLVGQITAPLWWSETSAINPHGVVGWSLKMPHQEIGVSLP